MHQFICFVFSFSLESGSVGTTANLSSPFTLMQGLLLDRLSPEFHAFLFPHLLSHFQGAYLPVSS